jgi:membrane protein YdbS with pleckstrin-like domain
MDYCINCGARLKATARFCGKCGAAVEDEETRFASDETRVALPDSEETRVAASAELRAGATRPRRVELQPSHPQPALPETIADAAGDAEERVIFRTRPTLLFVKIGYALAALGGLLLIALLAFVGEQLRVPTYVSVLLALALLLFPAYFHFRRNMVRYTLTESKIEIDEGFIAQTTRNIPLHKIQDVTVTTTFWQRLLRFGDVVVDNASEQGGTTVLRGIPDPRRHADLLLRELRRWQ